MKKILGLLLLAVSATGAFAQRQSNDWQRQQGNEWQRQQGNNNQNASLVITTQSQRQVFVSIDNSQVNQSNGGYGSGNVINIGSINSGNHTIVVYEMRNNIFGRQRQEIIYSSTLYLKPGYETSLIINGYGQATVSERAIYGNYNNGQGGYGNNGNGVGYGYGRKKNKHNKCDRDRDDDNRRGNSNTRGN